MKTKQKIKNIIILLSVMTILAITCVFYQNFNKFLYNFAFDKLNIVSVENSLIVHFIDVGQGDAVAINFPTGKTMLIDTGIKTKSVDYSNYIKNNVLANSFSNKIDYLILTHADMDHLGGTLRLVNNFELGIIYMPYIDDDTVSYLEVKDYIYNHCNFEKITNNILIEDVGCEVSVFGPFEYKDENDTSPVVKIEYNNKSFLFTGDVSSKVETRLIEEYGEELNCDVLKVAHHGSKNSTSEAFLSVVTPEYAVVSVGKNNAHDHPNAEVLERLKKKGANILRTDEKGNITFVVGDSVGFKCTSGTIHFTNLTLDYRVWILVVEIGLTVIVAVVILKNIKRV